jgi:hypothetical protein
MKSSHKIDQIIIWSTVIVLGWFLGRVIFWTILENSIGYDVSNYDAKRALYGMVFAGAISLILSNYRDRKSKYEGERAVDNIKTNSQTKFLEFLVFAFRIVLAGYIYIFWIKEGAFLLSQRDTIVVPNLFLVLLVLGIGVAVTTAISAYIIIWEPWRVFFIKHEKEAKQQLSLGIWRFISILIVNVLLFWFYTPKLGTKLPSALIFMICLTILITQQLSYSRTQKLTHKESM